MLCNKAEWLFLCFFFEQTTKYMFFIFFTIMIISCMFYETNLKLIDTEFHINIWK